MSRDLVERGASAGDWVRSRRPRGRCGGGGKADMAQAGGKEAAKIPQASSAPARPSAEMLAAPR